MDIRENVPLAELTTFRTGGPARFLLSCDSTEELPQAVAFARRKKLPLIPLGDGSNLLAPDDGVNAVFARLRANALSCEDAPDRRTYTAEAGVSWDALVLRAVEDGAWGIENLSAIPGSVGAAAVQNIGAYGAAFSDTAIAVTAYDTRAGVFRAFTPAECRFGYRASVFKEERDRYVITKVAVRLSKTPAPNLSYRDLAKRFALSASSASAQAGAARAPSLRAIRDAVVGIRAAKFPPLADYGTAGSFFLNPIVAADEIARLRARWPDLPFFDLPEGGVKVPLAWFLDRVLSLKGMRMGAAFLWPAQPLVIAVEARARSADVRALAAKVAALVREQTGIGIVPEVRTFPDESNPVLLLKK